ncbi:TetR/AcrR family transcriptional regulator [Plantactinospora sonchi]|uniref:TetR/AcrR family transcriptional regulator n=1 Tax=Plantactinospora sonchi TaxID=1544735 RepID=A0ABU7RS84_9ACTN
MAEILDAAAGVFADVGYERATTNAIAAAAGISPGSLYQFFPNKEAITEALADRFVSQMRDAHENAFTGVNFARIGLDELLDRVVDPILRFNTANPGFKAIFARPDMPTGLTTAAQSIQAALLGRVEAILAARAPGQPAAERSRSARVAIQIFQAMVPLVVAADDAERPAVTVELKKVLRGYLEPIIGR